MSENLNSNSFKKNDSNLNVGKSDYENLVIRLKAIKKTIAILEKTIFK